MSSTRTLFSFKAGRDQDGRKVSSSRRGVSGQPPAPPTTSGAPPGSPLGQDGVGSASGIPQPRNGVALPCCHCQAHGAQEALTLEAQLWIRQGPSTTSWTWEHSPLSLRPPSPRDRSGQEIGLPPISGGAEHCPAREEGCFPRTGELLGGSAERGQLGLSLTEACGRPQLPCSVWAAWGWTSIQTPCSRMAQETLGWAPWHQSVQGLQSE